MTIKVDIPGYYPVYCNFNESGCSEDQYLYSMTDANSDPTWKVSCMNVGTIHLLGPTKVSDVFGENDQRVIEITEI